MKKLFKLLIALAIIGGIAFGAMFIFNKGTNNSEIYTKLNGLSNIEEQNINIYEKTNETIKNMISLIKQKNYDLPEELAYFEVFNSFIKDYESISLLIEGNRIYINKANTNPCFKNMEKAYGKATKLYKDGYAYLKDTFLAITNEEHYNKDYVENFYNIFKNALFELNNFYINAGIAFVYGSNNVMDFNNKYKLEMEHYCLMINYHYGNYVTQATPAPVEEGSEELQFTFNSEEFINNKNSAISNLITQLNNLEFSDYIDNKSIYDELIKEKKLNKQLIVENFMTGKVQEYLDSITDENQKSKIQNYISFVIEG